MSENTNTLQQLRRIICLELRMPFFVKYGTAQTVTAGSTTTAPVDTKLTQADDYWNGDFFYHISTQASRQVTDFAATTDTLTLEYALSSITTGDSYELHSIWNTYDIHAAINRAIEQASKSFPDTVIDETIVLEEDKLAYTISGLTKKPWIVTKLWIERNTNVLRGTATSGSATDLTDTSLIGGISDVDTNWKISIYDGTGSGQIRTVSTADNTTGAITPSSNWTTNPDSTSKYALWNPTEQVYDWFKIESARFDAKEYPDTLYLTSRYPSLYGMRIRIEYLSSVTSLSLEADTTIINKEFIIARACSILHGQMVGDSRYNRELHYGEYVRYKDLADELLSRFRVSTPDVTLWTEDEQVYQDINDPLDWQGGII